MTIRLPDDLRRRLGPAAERDHRSVNAQIVTYIERGLDADDRDADAGAENQQIR
jgi:predicted transcriptional regulator